MAAALELTAEYFKSLKARASHAFLELSKQRYNNFIDYSMHYDDIRVVRAPFTLCM